MAKHSCIVKGNVMNRAGLCPLLQAWGGLFAGETLKLLEMCLRKVSKRTVEMLNKMFQQSSLNLDSKPLDFLPKDMIFRIKI